MSASVGVHRSHCCARHGCKYNDAACPVELRQVEQDHPCEYCDSEADMVAGLLDDELREQTVNELFLNLAVASKATGHRLGTKVTITVLGPDGAPVAVGLRALRVAVDTDGREPRVTIVAQQAAP